MEKVLLVKLHTTTTRISIVFYFTKTSFFMKTLTFKNGDQMPLLGLGTWKSAPGEVYQAIREAIRIGYRHFDCAAIYSNEKEVGQALADAQKAGEVTREELWITSKLWNSAHRKADVLPALHQTLSDLQLPYLDLYLVHWPVVLQPGVGFPKTVEEFDTLEGVPLHETWGQMEVALEKGLVRHIGVSNFNITRLKEISDGARHLPEMNQCEMHPFLPQQKLVDYCHSQSIHMTAYSPFGSPDRATKSPDEPSLFENQVIREVAQRHQATPAQVLVAWSVARGIGVIPKSVKAARLQQNFDGAHIELSADDMNALKNTGVHYRFINGALWLRTGSPYSVTDLWEM